MEKKELKKFSLQSVQRDGKKLPEKMLIHVLGGYGGYDDDDEEEYSAAGKWCSYQGQCNWDPCTSNKKCVNTWGAGAKCYCTL